MTSLEILDRQAPVERARDARSIGPMDQSSPRESARTEGPEPRASVGGVEFGRSKGPLAWLYQPPANPMQSAPSLRRPWVLEFEPLYRTEIEPLMGWTSSRDPLQQLRLSFSTKEAGLDFARRQGWRCIVLDPQPRRIRPKSYANNFRQRS